MPFMDGFECSRSIRNYYNLQSIIQPLIIACTGHVEDNYISKAWSMEIDEVAPKPISNELLTAILDEHVNIESLK